MPTVMAVVVAYNHPELTAEAVKCLLETSCERIVVWDNSRNHDVELAVTAGSDARVVYYSDGTNHGFGEAINRAVTMFASLEEVLIFVNPDCRIGPEAFEKLTDFAARAEVGAVAPRMRYPGGRYGIAGGPRPSLLKEIAAASRIDDLLPKKWRSALLRLLKRPGGKSGSLAQTMDPGSPLSVDWVSGFCMAISTQKFLRVGGFDRDFFLYFEDVDISIRLQLQGHQNFILRQAEAEHYESSTTTAAGKSNYYWMGYRVYLRKHGTVLARLVSRLLPSRAK